MGTYGPQATSVPIGAIILHPGDNISALVNAAAAGATFYFEAGVYRGVSLAPKDGQTFIGAQGAILNGSAVLTNWTTTRGNLWVIGGQTQQGNTNPSAVFEPGTQRPGYPETVFVDNTPLTPVDARSKVVAGTFYFDYAGDKIYIADNPAGHTVEAGKLTDAFHGSAKNVTVKNLVIEKYDPSIQDGAIDGDQGWIIQDNEVRLNYAVGITAHAGSQFIGNYVHDNGQMGLGGYGDNILVQNNELAWNGYWSGIDPYWEAGGFKFADTDNLVVRGNYSHDNKGTGLWTDINNIHILYEHNLVVHNTINGISHEISYDAIIRNNTLIGNGYGDVRGWGWGSEINIQNSKNVQVYGNRIDMTGGGNGIVLIQQDRGSGTYGTYTTTGNQIHDNIIVDRDGHGYIGAFADYNPSGMLNGGNTWTNNRYFVSDGGDRFQWNGSETFLQFKTATGETGSISQSSPDMSNWLNPSPAGVTLTGNGSLIGGPDADTLTGATGNDKLDGGAGADVMAGGPGKDIYYVDNAGDTVIEAVGAGNDTVYASVSWAMGSGQGIEVLRAYGAGATAGVTLTGNEFNNTLIGGSGNDTLNGGAGKDMLDGGAGADDMDGGLGSDLYIVDNAGDMASETNSDGAIDTVQASISHTLSQNIENLTLTGAAAINGTGNAGANVIQGNGDANVLAGKGGTDTLTGGGGPDTFQFDTPLVAGVVTTITDMTHGIDKIALDHTVFAQAGPLGRLDSSALWVGTAAHDSSDRVIYNIATGDLSYDPDGGKAQTGTVFAHVAPGLALNAGDFKVV